MSANNNATSGISFTTALTLLFVGLKLGHVITWSWVWVLAPLWIGWGVAIGVAVLILVMTRNK